MEVVLFYNYHFKLLDNSMSYQYERLYYGSGEFRISPFQTQQALTFDLNGQLTLMCIV